MMSSSRWLLPRADALSNAEAVNLGGSRARGDFRPDSDWDFAVYYRGEIDPGPFEELGWPGRVFHPFEWGQVMYGGAVFELDGRHFDVHFRNLDVVGHWTRKPTRADSRFTSSGFHLAGIPTYMLPGELAHQPEPVGLSGATGLSRCAPKERPAVLAGPGEP